MEILLSSEPESLGISKELEAIIHSVLGKAAELYGLAPQTEVSVLLVDNQTIQKLNKEYREKDAPTDVLSFALNEGDEPDVIDGPEGTLLGDIIISLEKAAEQAREYGHSIEREMAFLTVHGMLHLLGYDHESEADRSEMRQEEEQVLAALGIGR